MLSVVSGTRQTFRQNGSVCQHCFSSEISAKGQLPRCSPFHPWSHCPLEEGGVCPTPHHQAVPGESESSNSGVLTLLGRRGLGRSLLESRPWGPRPPAALWRAAGLTLGRGLALEDQPVPRETDCHLSPPSSCLLGSLNLPPLHKGDPHSSTRCPGAPGCGSHDRSSSWLGLCIGRPSDNRQDLLPRGPTAPTLDRRGR